MPSRNVYVREGAEALFEQAASIHGSLSGAIEEGLRLYVERQQAVARGLSQVELAVGARRLKFLARRLAQSEADDDCRTARITLFETARHQVAVWWSSVPNELRIAHLAETLDPANPENTHYFKKFSDPSFYDEHGVAFEVFASLRAAAEQADIPSQALADAQAVLDLGSIETLDI